jgi:hypothetical protein
MADEHSEPGGMKVLRLYADALGESRFETTTIPMALKEFAPPAAPLRVGPYALTSEGWNAILSLVECGGAGSRSETNSLAQ